MFEGLIDRFQLIRRKIIGYGRITDQEIVDILKDIRITLLEADVNYKVVKAFIDDLRTKCSGLELTKTLKPGDIVIKAVYEEMTELLGAKPQQMSFKKDGPLIVSLIGLQGVGKTTTAAKLALKYKNKNPVLVPADAKRPAAYEQLRKFDDISISEEFIGRAFFLENVTLGRQKLIFVARSGPPRIALFGGLIRCRDNLFIQSADGNITLNAPAGQNYVTVIRKIPARPDIPPVSGKKPVLTARR